MAQTPPPTINPAPPAPQRGVRATFSTLVDAFVTWLVAAVGQFNSLATNVYNNAVDAFNNANQASSAALLATGAASAASATANATLWVSGKVYQQDENVISPADRRTYRRRTAPGSGATDPSIDTVNYVMISAGSSAMVLIGSATVSSPVVNIDFLNIFSDVYTKYIIEIEGIPRIFPANTNILSLRLATGGVPSSGASDYFTPNGNANPPALSQVDLSTGVEGTPYTLTIEIYDARSLTASKFISARGRSGTSALNINVGVNIVSAISGFRLYWSSGVNFTSGKVKVYGIRSS